MFTRGKLQIGLELAWIYRNQTLRSREKELSALSLPRAGQVSPVEFRSLQPIGLIISTRMYGMNAPSSKLVQLVPADTRKPVIRAHPKVSVFVLENRPDRIVEDPVLRRVGGDLPPVVTLQSFSASGNPDRAVSILVNGGSGEACLQCDIRDPLSGRRFHHRGGSHSAAGAGPRVSPLPRPKISIFSEHRAAACAVS